MNFNVQTLGCKVNAYESEYIKELFLKRGYSETDVDNADVVVVNTCTVTNQADAKSRKLIRQVKRNNPKCILVVCGCAAENHKENLIDLDIDILIGNKDKSKIVLLVEDYKKSNEKVVKFYDLRNTDFEDMQINDFEGRMRGNIRSKELDTAIMEINCLVKNGYKEIVLTGIHTGSYGDSKNYDLTDLIHEISKNENLKRIRISSIEITELNEKFMEELKHNGKIVSHFHVPLQSGSDHVLKLMNRKYNILEYKKKIEELRSIREDINITTDLIVGFPEETDEDFIETLKNIKDIGFSKIHTFPFSLRSGTKAETLKQVSDTKKRERVLQVLKLSDELESLYYKKFLGKEVEVLVEDSKSGFTGNYIKVHLDKEMNANTFVRVFITSVDGLCVNGKVL